MRIYEIGAPPQVEVGIDPVTVVAVATTAIRLVEAINGPDQLEAERARSASLLEQLATVEATLEEVRRTQGDALTAATVPDTAELPDLTAYARTAALAGAAGLAAALVLR